MNPQLMLAPCARPQAHQGKIPPSAPETALDKILRPRRRAIGARAILDGNLAFFILAQR
jgi:hypothetical protein